MFKTEEERVKAREQYVAICQAADLACGSMRIKDWYYEDRFDRAFPPIAPPKMVPWEGWAAVRDDGTWSCLVPQNFTPASGFRMARVRVVEVDE